METTLECGVLGEQDFRFDCYYTPGRPGSFYARNGDPGDPPEADSCEIEHAWMIGKKGEAWPIDFIIPELSDEEFDRIWELAAESYSDGGDYDPRDYDEHV